MRLKREPPIAVWRAVRSCLLAVALAACSSPPAGTGAGDRPKGGVAEFREIVAYAMKSLDTTMGSLQQLTIRGDEIAFAAFAESVRRLELDSFRVRTRTQAMQARGEAYFEQWRAQLAQEKDQAVRQFAEEHREDLKRSFDQIFQDARETRQIFNLFLADLRKTRAVVERHPDLSGINSARSLIADTQKAGHRVQEGLAGILAELNSLSARLASSDGRRAKQSRI